MNMFSYTQFYFHNVAVHVQLNQVLPDSAPGPQPLGLQGPRVPVPLPAVTGDDPLHLRLQSDHCLLQLVLSVLGPAKGNPLFLLEQIHFYYLNSSSL